MPEQSLYGRIALTCHRTSSPDLGSCSTQAKDDVCQRHGDTYLRLMHILVRLRLFYVALRRREWEESGTRMATMRQGAQNPSSGLSATFSPDDRGEGISQTKCASVS